MGGDEIMVRQGRLNRRDVVVVLGCIAFALLALGAVGEGGRRRAREIVCQANLHQWHGIFQDYIAENDGGFLTGVDTFGYWWPLQLAPQYQDWKRNRAWFCPTAVTPVLNENGVLPPVLTTFMAWGIFPSPAQMTYKGRTYVMNSNGVSGSYGLNGYTLKIARTYEGGVPASEGWADLKDVPDAGRVPLFLDALRFDVWPQATDLPAADEFLTWSTPGYMGRCCINRHNGAVNCLFVDGSVRKVGLKELWTLKWHRSFNTAGPWTKAGGISSFNWPRWMRDFKEY
jgi:prepilin-type processing-associated H-X9-DG protein